MKVKESILTSVEMTPQELVRMESALMDATLYNQNLRSRCTEGGGAWRAADERIKEYKSILEKLRK